MINMRIYLDVKGDVIKIIKIKNILVSIIEPSVQRLIMKILLV